MKKKKKNKHTETYPKKTQCYIKRCVRYFLLHQHVQIFWYASMLMNKYCKAGSEVYRGFLGILLLAKQVVLEML